MFSTAVIGANEDVVLDHTVQCNDIPVHIDDVGKQESCEGSNNFLKKAFHT